MSTEQILANHGVRIEHLEDRSEVHEKILEKLRDRLPIWAVILISSLTGLAGGLFGYIIK